MWPCSTLWPCSTCSMRLSSTLWPWLAVPGVVGGGGVRCCAGHSLALAQVQHLADHARGGGGGGVRCCAGHYVALVKSQGQWICFDDDQVLPISEAQVRGGEVPEAGVGGVRGMRRGVVGKCHGEVWWGVGCARGGPGKGPRDVGGGGGPSAPGTGVFKCCLLSLCLLPACWHGTAGAEHLWAHAGAAADGAPRGAGDAACGPRLHALLPAAAGVGAMARRSLRRCACMMGLYYRE